MQRAVRGKTPRDTATGTVALQRSAAAAWSGTASAVGPIGRKTDIGGELYQSEAIAGLVSNVSRPPALGKRGIVASEEPDL